VDIFVIAATNRSLVDMVESGAFRRDLYYRLRGALVRVPALRERPSDAAPLIDHFLDAHGTRRGRRVSLSEDAQAALVRYSWPGNVRQLDNEIDNIVSQLDDGAIANTWNLSPEVISGAATGAGATPTFRERMDALLVAEVQRVLQATDGNRSLAAEKIGFSRRGFQKLLKRMGLAGTSPDVESD
jgi:Nif-specific regulatory protein